MPATLANREPHDSERSIPLAKLVKHQQSGEPKLRDRQTVRHDPVDVPFVRFTVLHRIAVSDLPSGTSFFSDNGLPTITFLNGVAGISVSGSIVFYDGLRIAVELTS